MKDSDAFILTSKWEEMGFVIIEAALSNLFVISSNCPNGPSEFLNYGKDGILFENNQKDALYQSLIKHNQIEEKIKFNNKIKIKKNSLNFTMFRHFKILNKILNPKVKTKQKIFFAKIIYKLIRIFFPEKIEVKRNNIEWNLNLSEAIDLHIFIFGSFEKEITKYCKKSSISKI